MMEKRGTQQIDSIIWKNILREALSSKDSEELKNQILFQAIRFTDFCSSCPANGQFCHSSRVAHYAVLLSDRLHLDAQTRNAVMYGARLHDVGKIGIPPSVLLKKEALNRSEYLLIKRHPEIGAEVLKHFPQYHLAIDGVLYHHERFDGSGYPYGLSGHEIPIEAQIIALSDAFDALTSNRPYRKALPIDSAIEILRQQTEIGRWNPFLFLIFEKMMTRERQTVCFNFGTDKTGFFS